MLLLLCGVDDERVALLVLPERIWLFVLTDVLLRCGDDEYVLDDERVVEVARVALVVLPLRISFFGREFTCPDTVLPLPPRLMPVARVADDWLLFDAARVVDEPTDLLLLLVAALFCDARPRTVAVLPEALCLALPTDDDVARAEPPLWLISPPPVERSLATPLADVRRRP